MAKTEKELAFLRELTINDEWTARFTELADKNLDLSKADNILYLNAGTGNHALAIREKSSDDTAVFAVSDTDAMLTIARDKAIAIGSDVDFSTIEFDEDSFDAVIADGSLCMEDEFADLVEEATNAAKNNGQVGVMFVSAASFGEVFSLLWEVLIDEDLGGDGTAAERMITSFPTLSRAEEIAEKAGLVNVETFISIEAFEYENGKEFVDAPLISDVLLPSWLNELDDDEIDRVKEKLAELIDEEDGSLAFRMTLKATLLKGEKA